MAFDGAVFLKRPAFPADTFPMEHPGSTGPAAPPGPARASRESGLEDDPSYPELRRFVFARLGVELAHYKNKCVERRLAVRLRARRCPDLAAYLELLADDAEELARFLAALTINVTEFFRNPACFERIRETCFPRILGGPEAGGEAARPARSPVRAWSVGCASGEEPYSLAIAIREHQEKHPEAKRRPVEILGTDLDGAMIARAVEGKYDEARLREVSAERRDRWFEKRDGGWLIGREARALVRFEAADAFRSEPAQAQDLILCRNMLIYFTREQQETIFARFHRILRPGGFLVLGKAEILIPGARKLFETICPRERIYERRA
jgi:chemotaxis protein methyltransferase CheR